MTCSNWRLHACLTCSHTERSLQGFLTLKGTNSIHLDQLTIYAGHAGLVSPSDVRCQTSRRTNHSLEMILYKAINPSKPDRGRLFNLWLEMTNLDLVYCFYSGTVLYVESHRPPPVTFADSSCNVQLHCLHGWTHIYSCFTSLGCSCWKYFNTNSLFISPSLSLYRLLVGIPGKGPAVRFFFFPLRINWYFFFLLYFDGRQESWDDWLSGSAAKSNSRVYLWTSVGATPTTPFSGDFY